MKKTVKLGTMGDIFIGLTYHPDDVSSEGTIVLRSSNIQDGRLDFSDVVRVKCSIRDNLFVKQNSTNYTDCKNQTYHRYYQRKISNQGRIDLQKYSYSRQENN